ncbi:MULTISPECIES: LysR family transcriptional regulator [unclassified Herbaspirillum]|uniref:LysR family transcriptional regulator n=1 Tax=unclassified Herbaspirillum TaxID=2624150 RepID=UPI000E2FAD7B|nr:MULTISPECIES: LysR family transcriptional regulator [unclassified Herbaspirillum]RFB71329.1 LysR family transcriptional regulator [Herbaspirillum sp. 3R-3a1]TFI08292.1 LysR family transcriptional regulator [Herbaspirillum sp. 3R11]TFI14707.1 LysR family transcriptional regulator [Herbaspirillum sp. 3R-11]TFI31901.1 LysR family transcriptional regulator [Herbaspirillum sp. 3C11]TFI32016.1 LysR family transcriptional regulator [Herbaspirillum sp. 3C11]
MTLKQLEAFYWAATCANFAIAAQRVHVSISSLSKRITELEQSLDVVLFDRSGYRAELTDAGQQLMPRALGLLDSAAAIRNSFNADLGLVGRCRFGVGELSALTWLPNFIAQARVQHPGLVLEPYVDVGAVLEERVDNGELDFAIIAGRSSRQALLADPIAQARFAWVAARSLCRSGVLITDLMRQGLPLIALPASAGTTRLLDDWLLSNHIAATERISCNNWGAIAGMIVAGVGVGMLPQGWAATLTRQKALAMPEGKLQLAPLTYAFHWRRGDSRPLLDKMRTLVAGSADFSAEVRLPGLLA